MDNVIREIEKRYDERGFFARVVAMAKGLRRPTASREYKEARIELQRLLAPLVALLSVSVLVVVLGVVTAVQTCRQRPVEVAIATAEEDSPELEPEDEPDPPEEPVDPTVDISESLVADLTAAEPARAVPAPPVPNPGGVPNKVAMTSSPVAMAAIRGTVKMRGFGDGDAGGFGALIGGGKGGAPNVDGCLVGTIIDFKCDAAGNPRREYGADRSYWKDARSLVESNWSAEALSKFFVPDKRVALTHLWVPPQSSANGPKAFGVGELVKPSGFAVHYTGEITAAEKGRYRFWGYFDDFMFIRANGKTVLDSEWNAGGLRDGVMTGWQTSDRAAVGRVKCPQDGGKMTPGDWFEVDAKRPVRIDLMVGERPGGLIGGVLLIEQEGVRYRRAPDGSMVLPIFASRPLSPSTKEELESAPYEMGVDSPRFNVRPRAPVNLTKGDVKVDAGI